MTDAEMNIKFEEGMTLYQQGDYEAAHNIWLDLAKNGHVQSHYELAMLYLDKNLDIQNNPHAHMHLGFATLGGWKDAEKIKNELEDRMSGVERDESTRLHANWMVEQLKRNN